MDTLQDLDLVTIEQANEDLLCQAPHKKVNFEGVLLDGSVIPCGVIATHAVFGDCGCSRYVCTPWVEWEGEVGGQVFCLNHGRLIALTRIEKL